MDRKIAGIPVLPNVVFQVIKNEKILRVFSGGYYVEIARTSGEVKRYGNVLLFEDIIKGDFRSYFVMITGVLFWMNCVQACMLLLIAVILNVFWKRADITL